jgi:peptidoglycan/LPS O-acetylase OafA/YrhL
MSMTLERSAKVPAKSSRWAWLALLASLVVYPLAIVVALGNQSDEWLPNLISTALVLLPPVAGVLLGVRSANSGNRLGGLATASGSAWLTFIVIFFVGANYIWGGESLVAPSALAMVLAVIVGGAVEAAWYRLWKAPHHSA